MTLPIAYSGDNIKPEILNILLKFNMSYYTTNISIIYGNKFIEKNQMTYIKVRKNSKIYKLISSLL
jgi:hypothetical protein